MFRKTIAVGPFELVASWVTGGTTVASPERWWPLYATQRRVSGRTPEVAAVVHIRRGMAKGARKTIVGCEQGNQDKQIQPWQRKRIYGAIRPG